MKYIKKLYPLTSPFFKNLVPYYYFIKKTYALIIKNSSKKYINKFPLTFTSLKKIIFSPKKLTFPPSPSLKFVL